MGAQIGLTNLLKYDMGGPSTDVCPTRDGKLAQKALRELAGFPVQTRAIDIHTIGAGGGLGIRHGGSVALLVSNRPEWLTTGPRLRPDRGPRGGAQHLVAPGGTSVCPGPLPSRHSRDVRPIPRGRLPGDAPRDHP